MTTIVGIDCATDERRVGVAFAHLRSRSGKARVTGVMLGRGDGELVERIAERIPSRNTLLALDAPLGWPEALGADLAAHTAGRHIPTPRDNLFSRHTDLFVWEKLGRRPLEVGADRIARTAHAALELLESLRRSTQSTIPLAWAAAASETICAIEVYPAATLAACGTMSRGYKRKGGESTRRELVASLSRYVDLSAVTAELRQSHDLLDAAVCVLAGADFLCGRCPCPPDEELARKEGWIWFRHSE